MIEIMCARCKAIFGMPEQTHGQYRNSHQSFLCPYCGIAQHFTGKTEADNLREQLKQSGELLRQSHLREENRRKSCSALRGVITKLKKNSNTERRTACQKKQ
jgi:hypothetical protein